MPERTPSQAAARVTVILPAWNATSTLPAQLAALAAQDFEGSWEIVLADNGSTDDLAGCVERCRETLRALPEIRLVNASRVAGAGYARSIALLHARGELIACCDADDVVAPGWLSALVRCLGEVDLATGPVLPVASSILDGANTDELLERLARDPSAAQRAEVGGVWGCNSGFRRKALSGFAPDLLYMEDAAVGRRATTAGLVWGFAEDALVLYRQPEDSSTSFRRGFYTGVGRVSLCREFPELGPALPHRSRSLAWLAWNAPGAALTARRSQWTRTLGRTIGIAAETVAPGLSVGRVLALRSRRSTRTS